MFNAVVSNITRLGVGETWKLSDRWEFLKDFTLSQVRHTNIMAVLQLHSKWMKQEFRWGVLTPV